MRRGTFRIHRLAVKLAALVSAGALVLLGGLASLYGALPFGAVLGGALLLGVGTYVAGHVLLGRRLELARTTLKQIRRHQFENLEAAHLPKGDELNALIWQVYRTGQVLEGELRELRKMENYRREFLGNVSHELKTPIFSIRGYAETLLEGALEDARVNRSFLDKILRNADRLNNLARDLSEISRIETGELKMTFEPFELRVLAAEVVEALEPIAEARQVKIQLLVPPTLPRVMGDRERIRQVLTNLVDNAVKYNHPGGHVEVVARLLPTGPVKVSVVDNGIGIAPQHIARVTERFYRVDKSRSRVQGGTGLGLAIVKHILGAHESKLMVESRPGSGSTFGFTLPSAAE